MSTTFNAVIRIAFLVACLNLGSWAFARATEPTDTVRLAELLRAANEALDRRDDSLLLLTREALPLARRAGPRWESDLFYLLGEWYGVIRQPDSSLHYHRLSYTHAGEAADSASLDRSRQALGSYHLRRGELEEAIRYMRAALEGNVRRQDFRGAANLLTQLSSAHRKLGLPEQAADLGRRAVTMAKLSGHQGTISQVTRTLAFLFVTRGRLDTALHLANESVVAADAYARPVYRIPAYGTRATVHHFREELEAALRDFRVVQSIEGDRPNIATLSNMATLLLQMGRGEEARQYYRRAVAIAERSSNLPALQQVYLALATANLAPAERDTVIHYLQLADGIRDSLQRQEARRSVLELEEQYAAGEREAEIALQASQLQRRNTQLYATVGGLILALAAGTIFYILARKLRRRNAQKEQLLTEKQALIGEVHHRVKNNLQVISSLLSLQGRQLAGTGAREALRVSRARVEAMGLIHQRLYHGEEVTTIYLPDYLRELSESLLDTYRLDHRVDLDCRVDEVDLDVDQAISLGLIVNELITNSLKYAFPDGRRGMIWIVLKRTTAGEVELTVSDNGVGQDAAAALDSSTAFGTELIAMMAQKLRATLQRPEGAEGAGYVTRLRFGI